LVDFFGLRGEPDPDRLIWGLDLGDALPELMSKMVILHQNKFAKRVLEAIYSKNSKKRFVPTLGF